MTFHEKYIFRPIILKENVRILDFLKNIFEIKKMRYIFYFSNFQYT